ncbi:uncharacterized protein LOC134839103 isoform X2 [Symsagittifera roscoffensis]
MVHENTSVTQPHNKPQNILESLAQFNVTEESLPGHPPRTPKLKNSGLFPPSLALFLTSEEIRSRNISGERPIDLTEKLEKRASAAKFNSKEVFEEFVASNRKCRWCLDLQTALGDMQLLGHLIHAHFSLVLLITCKRDIHSLKVLKDCWTRGVIRPPKNFKIDQIGEVGCFDISVLERCSPTLNGFKQHDNYHPHNNHQMLTDLICSSIVDMTDQNRQPDQTNILQACKGRQQNFGSKFSDDQILSALEGLAKNKKLQTTTVSTQSAPIYCILSNTNLADHRNSKSSCHNNNNRPLSFVNQHAGVTKENNQLFFNHDSENEKKFFTPSDPPRESPSKSPSKPPQKPVQSMSKSGSTENSPFNFVTNYTNPTTNLDLNSESDSPKNCVQTFSKLISRYKHNSSSIYTKKNQNLVSFNAQFPPEDGSNIQASDNSPVQITPSKFSQGFQQCQFKSRCSENCGNKELCSIVRQFRRTKIADANKCCTSDTRTTKEGSKFLRPSSLNRSSYSGKPETLVSSSYNSGCSTKFVAYLPEDMTLGSGSIVKCPINTPHWAKDFDNKDSRRVKRPKNWVGNYARSPSYLTSSSNHAKVEYSYHNYFHHQYNKQARRQRRKNMINYSPSRLTTSDEIYNVLCRGRVAGDNESRADAFAVVNTPMNTRAMARIQVMSSDDSVFSYYRAKYEHRGRRHRRTTRKREAEKRNNSFVTEPSIKLGDLISPRSCKNDGSDNSETSASVKNDELRLQNTTCKKENEDSGVMIDSHSPNHFASRH